MSDLRWVPVSERLPEQGVEVWGTVQIGKQRATQGLHRDRHDRWCWASGMPCEGGDVRVVAWMELPKPYEGSNE